VTRLDIPRSPALERVLAAISVAGGRPLLAGGAVRDAAFGLVPKDFDVEVYGLGVDPLTRALEGVGSVNAVGRSFGVLKVFLDGEEVDVSLPRRESKSGTGHRGFLVEPDPDLTPEEASRRRDFTINAMLHDPASGELLDFFGGLADLSGRVLRHVGPAFAEDPLRVLRGMQLAGRFDLTAPAETLELSRRLLAEYDTLAPERVWAEWAKWAAKSTHPSAGLRFLAASGWRARYPEIEALDGCPQEPEWHPEGDVWVHTLLVCDAAAAIAQREGLGADDRAVLLLAALCHDLGKPPTTAIEEGRVRSPGHAEELSSYAALLDRLSCPERIARRVIGLSRYHLAHTGFAGSARHVRRLARSLGEHEETIEQLARLVEADHSGRPPLAGGMPEPMAAMLALARELVAAAAVPGRLLLGRHLLEMGVAPGPRMGELLDAAYEAQLDGAFDTLEGAREWATRQLG
jgi:tRNA nucleotidyltransferase (CCA-adding enzyme)